MAVCYIENGVVVRQCLDPTGGVKGVVPAPTLGLLHWALANITGVEAFERHSSSREELAILKSGKFASKERIVSFSLTREMKIAIERLDDDNDSKTETDDEKVVYR